MNVVPTLPLTFEALYRFGYTRLVPIIPPGSPISEKSSLFKRVGTDQDRPGAKAARIADRERARQNAEMRLLLASAPS